MEKNNQPPAESTLDEIAEKAEAAAHASHFATYGGMWLATFRQKMKAIIRAACVEYGRVAVAKGDKKRARLFDLVRHQRGQLHGDGLITDEEYAVLCVEGSGISPDRLSTYDDLKVEVERDLRVVDADRVRASEGWNDALAEGERLRGVLKGVLKEIAGRDITVEGGLAATALAALKPRDPGPAKQELKEDEG